MGQQDDADTYQLLIADCYFVGCFRRLHCYRQNSLVEAGAKCLSALWLAAQIHPLAVLPASRLCSFDRLYRWGQEAMAMDRFRTSPFLDHFNYKFLWVSVVFCNCNEDELRRLSHSWHVGQFVKSLSDLFSSFQYNFDLFTLHRGRKLLSVVISLNFYYVFHLTNFYSLPVHNKLAKLFFNLCL